MSTRFCHYKQLLLSSSLKKQTNLKQSDRKDVLAFLDSLRKSETAYPLHRWIGTYNLYRVHIIRFFKWLYYPDIEPDERPKPPVVENIQQLKRKEKSIYKVVSGGNQNTENMNQDSKHKSDAAIDNELDDIPSPFDAVVLDYKMPDKNGMEVAKEILQINPHQRIIFASAYVIETLKDVVRELNRVVELLQKPFSMEAFVSTIEDNEAYEGLKMLMVNIREIEARKQQRKKKDVQGHSTSEDQIKSLFEGLRKIQKYRTF